MLPIEVLKLDHVAMASWDPTRQARLLTDVLGARFIDGGDNHHAGFRWLQFALGGGKVEIIEPLVEDNFLCRFLTRRGEGLHHMTLYVADIGKAIDDLEGAGYRAVDIDLSHEGWKEAFLHPHETGGVLIQLAETDETEDPEEPPPTPLEAFLADRPSLRPD